MKKVVIITNIMAPYRVDLFNYISKTYTNYDITVIYSTHNEDNREWEQEEIKHKFIILKSKTIKLKSNGDYKYIHLPIDILKQLNKIEPDIIIGSEYNPTIILSYIYSKLNRKKFISWSDGTLNSEQDINFLQRTVRGIICKNSDALIASSSKTKEAQIRYGAKSNKIFVSYLTIDINKYIIEKNRWGNKKLLYVGRLVELKGLDLLLKALSNIKKIFELTIVGSGDIEHELKILSEELHISDRVKFVGFKQREELVKIYKESDIFILPTKRDCFGLVISEAMCAGLPVLCSRYADGVYDLIDEGKGGKIIDPMNVDEFAKSIEKFLSDEDYIKQMGMYNQEKIKSFSIEKVSIDYIRAIESVIV